MSKQAFEVRTTHLIAGGAALGRLPDGRAVFVSGGAPDELVSVELMHEDKEWTKGRIVEILARSAQRVDPPFPASALGGATWAHIDYQTQLAAKQQIVQTALERIGKFSDPTVEPIVASPEQWRYRNRIELTFGRADEQIALGFLMPGSDTEVVSATDVALFDERIVQIIARINDWVRASGLAIWQPGQRTGQLRNLLVRRSSSGELVINLSTSSQARPDPSLVSALAHLPLTGITWSISDAPTVLHDLSSIDVLQGSPYLSETLGGQRLRYHVMDFFQVNPPAVELLIEQLRLQRTVSRHSELVSKSREVLNLSKDYQRQIPKQVRDDEEGNGEVIDLYAGVGLLGVTTTSPDCLLTLVESHPQSTNDALENVTQLGRARTTTVAQATAEAYVAKFPIPDGATVIVDPPRSGLHRTVVDALLKADLTTLIYVSCDPATLARDLHLLSVLYRPIFIQPFDFFPQTPHVETVVELLPRSS